MKNVVLNVQDLTVHYKISKKVIHAVENVSFKVEDGEFVGIVGESGSGKSTLAHTIIRLLPINAIVVDGRIELLGYDVLSLGEEDMRKIRWKEFSMVFQKSLNALSPVHKVGNQLADAMKAHNPNLTEEEIIDRLKQLLRMVNLPERVLKAYPHQLSGGMMQRIMIALALLNHPKFIIFDEATTALDVVTQGQIIEEIKSLVKSLSLTGLVISHDLGVVSELCDEIVVMYAGRLVEHGTTEQILQQPLHPYTQGLVRSLPDFAQEKKKLSGIPGNLPDLSQPVDQCVFAPRCPIATEECFKTVPNIEEVDGRRVACLKVGARV
ncbi:MAG: Oligopeptide transport ATP-binding protein OppD [Euryarchaeota archaeon 55_53]|nr:MAG: Oligopeptide transport ATP-binding protein OppD [Euryarchaeota archaeon 55_53]